MWEKHYSNNRLPNHVKRGSFWWRNILKLLDKYKGMALASVQDGSSCLFWTDCWLGQPLSLANPELCSFAKKKEITVKQAISSSFQAEAIFNLPLSAIAFEQFLALQQKLQSYHFSDDKDQWSYIWGSPAFTSKKAYKHLRGTSHAHPIYKWIWKSSCQHNHKVFFWLLVRDRLSTRNILRRKSMQFPSYNCVSCPYNLEEIVDHLFLECDLAKACWGLIGLIVISTPDPVLRFQSFKQQIGKPFFMEIIIVMCWCIWMLRNDAIFRGI